MQLRNNISWVALRLIKICSDDKGDYVIWRSAAPRLSQSGPLNFDCFCRLSIWLLKNLLGSHRLNGQTRISTRFSWQLTSD